jgi:hypothetical protein
MKTHSANLIIIIIIIIIMWRKFAQFLPGAVIVN